MYVCMCVYLLDFGIGGCEVEGNLHVDVLGEEADLGHQASDSVDDPRCGPGICSNGWARS